MVGVGRCIVQIITPSPRLILEADKPASLQVDHSCVQILASIPCLVAAAYLLSVQLICLYLCPFNCNLKQNPIVATRGTNWSSSRISRVSLPLNIQA